MPYCLPFWFWYFLFLNALFPLSRSDDRLKSTLHLCWIHYCYAPMLSKSARHPSIQSSVFHEPRRFQEQHLSLSIEENPKRIVTSVYLTSLNFFGTYQKTDLFHPKVLAGLGRLSPNFQYLPL